MGIELTVLLISLMLVSSQVFMLRFFLNKISKLQSSISKIHISQMNLSSKSKNDNKMSAKMIEGEIDLVFKGRKASLKAVFYPKKII